MTICWGITSGQAGMVAQVRALADIMGLTPIIKNAQLCPFIAWLPNVVLAPLRPIIIPHCIDPKSEALVAPWPDIVISCGRWAAMVAMGLKAKVPATTQFIHIQDPHVDPHYFDAVVAMEHDKISGANVIKLRYALHSITPERLQYAAQQFVPAFAAFPKPYIAVLIGGSTNKYRLGYEAMRQLIEQLQQLLQMTDGSLLITPSRRTGPANIAMLHSVFSANPRVYIYDLVSENPYMGMLGLADWIVVTNDSVNMMSEARASGKPVYLLPLSGHQQTKPARFGQMLLDEGCTRLIGTTLEHWSYPAGDDTEELVNRLSALI